MPSLNSLRAFEAVARHLSYQLAAEELRVTPAAVKQLVSKLEASVGSPLLERKGRGLALTPGGLRGGLTLTRRCSTWSRQFTRCVGMKRKSG